MTKESPIRFRNLLIALIPLALIACEKDSQDPQRNSAPPSSTPVERERAINTFPWIVTIPEEKCIPNNVFFAAESGHLYEFAVEINGENIIQDYIITAKGSTVEFRKPDGEIVEKVEVGKNFGLLGTLEEEPKPIAKILGVSNNLISFMGCS